MLNLFMEITTPPGIGSEAEMNHIPEWYRRYSEKLRQEKRDLIGEVESLSHMDSRELSSHIGGSIEELPYEFLQTMFIDGTDDVEVAGILRKKREGYLKDHPEKQVARGASEGIITFDGRFIPKEMWNTASPSQRIGWLVGSTCFHYNSDTPGMDSSPDDV